jgi:hypothetical protein
VVAPASGDAAAAAVCAADAEDVALAEAGTEADELESCGLHPTMRTPATARAAPISSVRPVAILVIFLRLS